MNAYSYSSSHVYRWQPIRIKTHLVAHTAPVLALSPPVTIYTHQNISQITCDKQIEIAMQLSVGSLASSPTPSLNHNP